MSNENYYPVYSEGCLSAAWRDLTANGPWVGKCFFLGLVQCVPILNFVVSGYAYNWSREVPFGAKSGLPQSVVTGRNFEIGFYLFVINIVFGLVGSLIATVFALVPLIGWIAAFLVEFVVLMFVGLASMRTALLGQLGEGFSLSKLWTVFQRNWSNLLIVVLVPSLVVGFIGTVFAMLFSIIGFGGLAASGALLSSANAIEAVSYMVVGTAGIFVVLFCIVIYWVMCSLSVVSVLLVARGLGHWVARYASEWAEEAASRGVVPPQY